MRRTAPSMRVGSSAAMLLVVLAASACSSPPPRETTASPSSAPAAPGPAPIASSGPTPPAAEPPAVGSAAPPASSGAAPGAAPVLDRVLSDQEVPPGILDHPQPEVPVEVKNIGMHVGGGKNDAPEKAPIKRSVEPHMPAFAKCFAKADDPAKGGDFGVDLRIEKGGGQAVVSHPRTSLKGDGFKECVLAVFEAVDFEKPTGGITTVSYSLRFTPKKQGG